MATLAQDVTGNGSDADSDFDDGASDTGKRRPRVKRAEDVEEEGNNDDLKQEKESDNLLGAEAPTRGRGAARGGRGRAKAGAPGEETRGRGGARGRGDRGGGTVERGRGNSERGRGNNERGRGSLERGRGERGAHGRGDRGDRGRGRGGRGRGIGSGGQGETPPALESAPKATTTAGDEWGTSAAEQDAGWGVDVGTSSAAKDATSGGDNAGWGTEPSAAEQDAGWGVDLSEPKKNAPRGENKATRGAKKPREPRPSGKSKESQAAAPTPVVEAEKKEVDQNAEVQGEKYVSADAGWGPDATTDEASGWGTAAPAPDATSPISPSGPKPFKRLPAYTNPDRVRTGGAERTKLTAEELAAKMEKMRLQNEKIKQKREEVEADEEQFHADQAATKAREEAAAKIQSNVNKERQKVAEKKIAQAGHREWDLQKLDQNERNDFSERGRGRGRGRRGRGRGGPISPSAGEPSEAAPTADGGREAPADAGL